MHEHNGHERHRACMNVTQQIVHRPTIEEHVKADEGRRKEPRKVGPPDKTIGGSACWWRNMKALKMITEPDGSTSGDGTIVDVSGTNSRLNGLGARTDEKEEWMHENIGHEGCRGLRPGERETSVVHRSKMGEHVKAHTQRK